MKVLIVEEERLLANSVRALLEAKGFQVEVVFDGEDGAAYVQLGIYDLLILDMMMPKMDGLAVTRQVRSKHCPTPILMLSESADVEDRIQALNAGVDYYLTKPFDPRELLACINALMRRRGGQVDELSCGNTTLDLSTHLLICGEKSIRLSAREFEMMQFLLCSKDQILPKELILSRIWGFNSNAVENHVEVYIGFLRKKLHAIGSNVGIENIRRVGYHLQLKHEN